MVFNSPLFLHKVLQLFKDMQEFMFVLAYFVEFEGELDKLCEYMEENEEKLEIGAVFYKRFSCCTL